MIPTGVYSLINDFLPMVILVTVVGFLVRLVLIVYAKQKVSVYQDFKLYLTILYCFALFELVTTTDFYSYTNNFIPFKEILRYKSIISPLFLRNVVGNIILFVPFGFLISDFINSRAGKINIFITSLLTLVTSTSIETIQMFIGRSFDIDDIILNFIGSIIGYIAFKLINKTFGKANEILKLIALILFFAVFIISLYIILVVFK
jgi:glycopeptide antibiotics resistance protein